MPSSSSALSAAQRPSPQPRLQHLPEGVSPSLVALLELSDGEEELENNDAKAGNENVNVDGEDADALARAPLRNRKTSSSSSSPLPPLSPSERARAFAAAPRELEALKNHPVIASALFLSNGGGGEGGATTTATTATEDAAASAEAAAVEAFVLEAPALSRLASAATEADCDLKKLEATLSGFQGSLGTISGDIRGLQAASAALARKLSARRAAAAALAGALDALALPPRLARAVSEGDPSSPEFAAALADLSRRMRKFSGKEEATRKKTATTATTATATGLDKNSTKSAPASFPLRASRAAAEVLPQLDALRRAAATRSKGWLIPAINSLKAPRTNVHVLQRSVLAPRRALLAFLREFGDDDYFTSPVLSSSSSSASSSSSSSSSSSAAYADVRKCYVETLSSLLSRHLRRYANAVGRATDFGGTPLLVGTGLRPQIAASARAPLEHDQTAAGGSSSSSGPGGAVVGALAAFVDAVASASSSSSHSSSNSSSNPSGRSLDAAERGAILLHLDRPALVPGAMTAAAAAGGGGARAGAAGSSSSGPSTPTATAAGARRPPPSQPQQRPQQQLHPPPEEAFRSVCRLLADTATAEYVFCADFFGGDGAFRDGFGGAPLQAAEGFLMAQIAECDDPIALLLMARVVRHSALTMAKRRVPGLDAHHDRLTLAIWPRLQLVLDAHVASLEAVESSSGGSGSGGGGGVGGIAGFFSAAASSSPSLSPFSSSEPALPGGAFHPLASRAGALEGALLALSSPAEAGQLAMSLRRLRRSALAALARAGDRRLSRASGGGAVGRAEAAAFVAGNAHAVLGLLEGAAADAAARSHAGGSGSGSGESVVAAAAASSSSTSSSSSSIPSSSSSHSFTSPVFAVLGVAGADAAAHWQAAFEAAALEVASEPLGRRFPGLLEAARALERATKKKDEKGSEEGSDKGEREAASALEQEATAAAREALSAAFSPALPSSASSASASSSAASSWASSLDAVRADVARYLRKNPGAARSAASLAAAAVGGAYATCFAAVCGEASSPHVSSSPRAQQQQQQWPAPAVVARECARQ